MEGQYESLLDEVLPRYDFHEVHETFVPARPDRTYEALKSVSADEIRLLGPLMRVRNLPATLARRPTAARSDMGGPVLDQFLRAGFAVLGERPARELVAGAVGRFWSPASNQPRTEVRTRDDFVRFSSPGFVKAAMNFLVTAEGQGSRITTETRIAATDVTARARFRRYWLLIRVPSGAIRRSWLNAIRRRVEREGG
jgi:hypothetical protein